MGATADGGAVVVVTTTLVVGAACLTVLVTVTADRGLVVGALELAAVETLPASPDASESEEPDVAPRDLDDPGDTGAPSPCEVVAQLESRPTAAHITTNRLAQVLRPPPKWSRPRNRATVSPVVWAEY